MKIKIAITLTDDEYTEGSRETQVEIEESIPEGFQNLDKWEQNVHQIGFKSMRELFICGIRLFEEKVLSEYTHKNEDCEIVKRGYRDFTLKTVMGELRFPRQRMFCKTCGEWVIPINEALGLHDEEQERATIGFKELSCLYAIHHPYRSAAEKMDQVTQDPQVVSHEQIRQIVQTEGRRVREREEEERKDAVFCFVKSIQNSPNRRPSYDGRLYVNMDGILVHSSSGKGRYHEGKVGFICTEEREPAGRRVRVTRKRYVSSFQKSYVLGSRVRGEALKLGVRAYKKVFILGDGARWIRKVRELCFPGSIYILDWYHLRDNLYTALRLTLPYEESLRRAIYKKVSMCFWRGLKKKALRQLWLLHDQLWSEGKQKLLQKREGLDEFIGYVNSNWEGIIDYQEMYRAGYLVASSLAEKAADLVVAKRQKKHQGMHWTRMGADNLSALRTLWLNGDWEEYWRERREKIVA
jgi:hypothetical protein